MDVYYQWCINGNEKFRPHTCVDISGQGVQPNFIIPAFSRSKYDTDQTKQLLSILKKTFTSCRQSDIADLQVYHWSTYGDIGNTKAIITFQVFDFNKNRICYLFNVLATQKRKRYGSNALGCLLSMLEQHYLDERENLEGNKDNDVPISLSVFASVATKCDVSGFYLKKGFNLIPEDQLEWLREGELKLFGRQIHGNIDSLWKDNSLQSSLLNCNNTAMDSKSSVQEKKRVEKQTAKYQASSSVFDDQEEIKDEDMKTVGGADQKKKGAKATDTDSNGSDSQESTHNLAANIKCPADKLKKRVQKQLDKEDDGTSSIAASTISKVTHKTTTGAFKRHCEPCGFKLIGNWAEHKKKIHNKGEVPFVRCDLNCTQCQDGNVVQQQKVVGHQSEHKVAACFVCGQTRQARYLTNGMCAKCAKTESKSVINVATEPLTKPLTSHNLSVLPDDVVFNEEVKEQLIHKRLHQEYEQYAEDIPEFIAPQPLNKRVKGQQSLGDCNQLNGGQELDTVMKDTTSITEVSASATGMVVTSLLDALRAIEASTDTDFEVSLEVSAICEQFVHQQALTLLKKDSYPRFASLITKILNEQAGELKQQQLAGLFVAACKLQGPCWSAAVIMLQRRKNDIQQYVLEVFNSNIEVTYGTDIAQWVGGQWRNVQEQQLDIMKQLKGVQSPVDILFLSLAVQVDDVLKFIKHSSFMLQRDVSVYMLESIYKRLTQQRLSVQQFLELCELIQLDNVKSIIQNNADIFKSTPLQQWTTKVQELKAISHLMNSESVQEAVGEYLRVYGDVDATFTEDMFSEDTLLGLAMHESFNKPTAKQLGLAQYCMGKIKQCQRQLWCVPSGQGKSRIIAFAAAIAAETGMFSAVHISYENEALLDRDRHDFESLWIVLGCVDKINYHVGCDFPTQEGELVIVDESDTATFNTPDAFIKLTNGRACICFTATPDNCDGKGVETKVISALKLDVFHYVPDAEVVDAATRLKTDHTQQADSIDAKVSYIKSLVLSGPVLIYGTAELKEALALAVSDLIVVDPKVDYSMLRKLDQAPYKVLFADTQFGMRGIDYRCERVPMQLVIAQPFSCTREALQGVARVGRFGDLCTRIIFSGVELVDKMQQLQYSSKLIRYAAMAKINIKQVKVKQAAAPQQRNSGATNVGRRQVQAAQAQTAQQKFMKDFTTKNT